MARSEIIDRPFILIKIRESLPAININIDLLSDQQILILLLNEDLKTLNLSYKQIMNRYRISERTARTIKFIVVNARKRINSNI